MSLENLSEIKLKQEDELEILLNSIPKELKEKQETNGIWDKPDLAISIKLIKELILLRQNSEWKIETVHKKYQAEALKCIKKITESRYLPSNLLGKGMCGIVYIREDDFDMCVKYIHDPSKIKNSIRREFDMLGSVAELKTQILKFPTPHTFLENRDSMKSVYTMDHIRGLTALEIYSNPARFENLYGREMLKKVQANLTNKEYMAKIVNDIELMHANNIIHADLHEKNIMIDENGDVFVIDFGNSINLLVENTTDKDYDRIENIKNQDLFQIKNSLATVLRKINEYLS